MKRISVCVLAVPMLLGAAFGQASFYQFPVPLPGATFRVCPVGTQNPCPSPSSIFSDQALTQLISQPAQTGPTGQYGFWVSTGQYTIQIGQPYNFVYVVNLGGNGGGGSASFTPVIKASVQLGATSDVQITNAIASFPGGSGIIWADYGAPQTWVSCPTWGVGNVHLVLYPVTFTITPNCTIPANVTLELKQGAKLSPTTGTTTTILGPITSGLSTIFANAGPGQGIIDFTGNGRIQYVYPEWWGASNGASASTNTAALQSMFLAATGQQNRTNLNGLSKWNIRAYLSTNYNINGEIQLYHVNSLTIECQGKLNSGITQTANNQRIFDGQNIAYMDVVHCGFASTATQTGGSGFGPLIDLDNDHTHGTDLSPQNISFRDDTFNGNGITDVAVLVAKHGGDAQGDNVRFEDVYGTNFTGAAIQCGGDNTGRNVGRFQATNCYLQITGGDFQGNPNFAIASYSGGVKIDGPTMENDVVLGTQTGFDVFSFGSINGCSITNVRSESHKLAGVDACSISNSHTIFQAAQWYSPSRSQSLSGTVASSGNIISGTGVAGDGKYYIVTVGGTFGGLGITSASAGGATTITVAGTPWSVNAFTGYLATIMTGAGVGEYCLITSNTSSVITCSGGWQTQYAVPFTIVNPNNTSTFVVEPNWGTQTTSGGVTWAAYNFNVIEGANAATCLTCTLDNVNVAGGGQIKFAGQSRLNNVTVSRADWNSSSFPLDDTIILSRYDVTMQIPDSAINIAGAAPRRAWAFPRNGSAGGIFKGYSQLNLGTQPLCWSAGQAGGGTSYPDICMGGQSDSSSQGVLNFFGGPNKVASIDSTGLGSFPKFTSFNVPFTSFSAIAQAFPSEIGSPSVTPRVQVGNNDSAATMWIFNDRDGSDSVDAALYVDSFITNNVARGPSIQSTALAAQSRATGSANYGFLSAATFNTQYNGSAILDHTYDGFFALPRNQGSGTIANTVGIHIAHQDIAGVTTAHGIEFETMATSSNRFYNIYQPGGNNWLGPDNTWVHKITLGCPATEQICTDTFANLGSEPNGTMKYCSDCTVATPASCTNVTNTAACTCAASGTGAIAKRINSVWMCN